MSRLLISFSNRPCGLGLKKTEEVDERKEKHLLFVLFPGLWKIEDLRLIDMFIQTEKARKQTKEAISQFQVFFEIQV